MYIYLNGYVMDWILMCFMGIIYALRTDSHTAHDGTACKQLLSKRDCLPWRYNSQKAVYCTEVGKIVSGMADLFSKGRKPAIPLARLTTSQYSSDHDEPWFIVFLTYGAYCTDCNECRCLTHSGTFWCCSNLSDCSQWCDSPGIFI